MIKSFLIWVCLLGVASPVCAEGNDLYPNHLPRIPTSKIRSASFPVNVQWAIQNHLIFTAFQYCLLKNKKVDKDASARKREDHGDFTIEFLGYDYDAQIHFSNWMINAYRKKEANIASFSIYKLMSSDCRVTADAVNPVFEKFGVAPYQLNEAYWKQHDEYWEKEQEK